MGRKRWGHADCDALPATQTALIVEMQEWFIAHSANGSATDESTIRLRIKVIWRALNAA